MAPRKRKTTSTDSSKGADAPKLQPLVQAVADELTRLDIDLLVDVEAILAIELANELSGFLCKNRAGLTKELRSVMAELRARNAGEPEADEWDEAMAALSEPA